MIDGTPKVFISYANQDAEAAKRLNDDLKSRGVNTWLDKECIIPGEKWEIAIKKAIEDSQFFLAVLSSNGSVPIIL
jgi:hypothetical protein